MGAVIPAVLTIAAAAVSNVALQVALLVAAYVLTPKPKEFGAGLRDRLRTARSSVTPWRVIFGRARVGGAVVFAHSTDDHMHVVVVLACHRIKRIGQLYFGGKPVQMDHAGDAIGDYEGHVRSVKMLGDPDQLAIQELIDAVPEKWTADHRLRGRAYVYMRLSNSSSKFPNGVPNMTWDVEGHDQVYDPRTDSYGYSENAALCTALYLTDTSFGLGEAATAVYTDELTAAANLCDEDIELQPSGTEKRYTCNGIFLLDESPEDILGRLLRSMGGSAVWQGGQWRILPAAYRAPTVTLTEGDAIGPIEVQTRVSRRELANAVKGVFISKEHSYQATDYPAVTNQLYEDEDGERIPRELDLPMTITASACQRLAKIELERGRQQITVQFRARLGAYKVAVGDCVAVTMPRYGWDAKPFEVVEASLGGDEVDGVPSLGIDMTLRETAAAVYAWNSGEETLLDPEPDTELGSPFGVQLGPEAEVGGKTAGSISGRVENLNDSGQATPALTMERPAGSAAIARATQSGTARDGDAVTFVPAFDHVPVVKFNPRCKTLHSPWSGGDQYLDVHAENVSAAGFTLRARIKREVTGTVEREALGSSNEATKTQAAEAVDDRYTFVFDVQVAGSLEGKATSTVVGFYTKADGGPWVRRGTRTYINDRHDAQPEIFTGEIYAVTVDGLGANAMFRTAIEESHPTGFEGQVTLTRVYWSEAAAPETVTATPDDTSHVEWIGQEGA